MLNETPRSFFDEMMSDLRTRFPTTELVFWDHIESKQDQVLLVPVSEIALILERLKYNFHFRILLDICGVDWPERELRFEIVYILFDDKNRRRLRVKTNVREGEPVPTVTHLWRAANWAEREAWDMFGVEFAGHGDLRRILCHHDFVGHALRKDYPANAGQVMTSPPIPHTYEKQIDALQREFGEDLMLINIGPAHPITHGTLRFMAVIDGSEVVHKCDTEIGYLHRCFEKMCETHNYNQIIPYTDRLNYCSSPLNNNAYARCVEKLLNIDIPPRAKIIRMIIDELSRIMDHFVCVGSNAVDLGAMTGFFYLFAERERIYDLFEKICGARMTVSLTRIGGLGFDLPNGWCELCTETLKHIEKSIAEVDKLLTNNRIFVDRTKSVGVISAELALDYGFVGPCLRASGIELDLRVEQPYDYYADAPFDVPIGNNGDTYDRYLVRMEEMRQSIRIIRWCLKNLPCGPIVTDSKRVALPSKKDVYGNIEGLMNQFMLVIDGVKVPPGETYSATESPNGELGFYIVSDGTGTPHRVKCRAPSFYLLQGFPEMIMGGRLADVSAALASINIIAGELDR